VYAIAAVIDDFINRVMDNPRLNANPKVDEAHHRVSRAGFKYLVTEMVCWATGGPQQYTGRSMRDSHVHLDITEEEWQVFMADLQACLDHCGVPKVEQGEIVALVESTKGDIVLPTSPRSEATHRATGLYRRQPQCTVGRGLSPGVAVAERPGDDRTTSHPTMCRAIYGTRLNRRIPILYSAIPA
jgi:hemoglobin